MSTIAFVVGIAVFAGMVTFRGCASAEDAPDAIPIYRTIGEAARGMEEAAALSIDPLEDFFADKKLSEKQERDLQNAERLITGVIAFDPDQFNAYVAVGRIEFALADYDQAELALREAVRTMPDNPKGDLALIVAETHYLLSRTLFEKRLYAAAIDEAEIALALAPGNVDNLTARAAALIQVGKSDQAAKDLAEALDRQPYHPRANRLQKLLAGD